MRCKEVEKLASAFRKEMLVEVDAVMGYNTKYVRCPS